MVLLYDRSGGFGNIIKLEQQEIKDGCGVCEKEPGGA